MGDVAAEAEVVVIGGGPGGYAAAFRAADLGLDVTLVDLEERLGGVCLLRGCIPSKALLHLVEVMADAEWASGEGIAFDAPEVDLDGVRSFRDRVVDRLTGGLGHIAKQRGVHVMNARARFDEPGRIRLDRGDVRVLEYEHAIIATGSRPIPLRDAPFSDRIMDSGRALALPDVPERLVVVGAGYVGLEMGSIYAALGSRVTVVEMTDRIMPAVDPDLARPLARRLKDRFEAIHLSARVSEVDEGGDGVHLRLEGEDVPDALEAERVLVAIGRRPNSDDLGLEHTAVERRDDGTIAVDESRCTAEEGVFAIGDVAGGMMLAHKAFREGKVAAEVIAGQPSAFDARAVPAVVYTDPQVAWCGLTERQAEREGIDVAVSRFPWKASGRAVSMGAEDGFTKVLFDPESHRVLGVGIVGRDAESLIAEGVLAVEMAAVAEDLAMSIHPHPTLSETLGEAAELFLGGTTHLGRRRK